MGQQFAGERDKCHASPASLGYHSRAPREYWIEGGPCDLLDGDPCWYDGSTTQAGQVFELLIAGGDDAVWGELDRRYDDTFCDEEAEAGGAG